MHPPLIVIPIRNWNKITRKALIFSNQISDRIYAVHVETDEKTKQDLEKDWQKFVLEPARRAGVKPPELVALPSPYRRFFGSMIEFIEKIEAEHPDRNVAIVIPDLAEFKWYQAILHNQRAILLNAALYLRRDPRIVVITVPWFLES